MLNILLSKLAKAMEPKRARYVVVGTRVQTGAYCIPMFTQVKGGAKKPRVLQRVLDLRNVKPREARKGKPWRHNETTNLMKRWLAQGASNATR